MIKWFYDTRELEDEILFMAVRKWLSVLLCTE